MSLTDFLHEMANAQAAVARCTVRVEWVRDGERTEYTMSCLDKRSLQHSVQQRMDDADRAPHGGFAQFLTPWMGTDGRWMTRGEVVIFTAQEAAE